MPLKAFQNSGLHPNARDVSRYINYQKDECCTSTNPCTSKCHLFIVVFRPFPRSKVSHFSSSASRRTGRPICIKTSRCALDQTLRDWRLESLRTSWSWKCYFKATFFGVLEFHPWPVALRCLKVYIQNISFRVLGNPSERTWPTSTARLLCLPRLQNKLGTRRKWMTNP